MYLRPRCCRPDVLSPTSTLITGPCNTSTLQPAAPHTPAHWLRVRVRLHSSHLAGVTLKIALAPAAGALCAPGKGRPPSRQSRARHGNVHTSTALRMKFAHRSRFNEKAQVCPTPLQPHSAHAPARQQKQRARAHPGTPTRTGGAATMQRGASWPIVPGGPATAMYSSSIKRRARQWA